jgi:hypothetical protein
MDTGAAVSWRRLRWSLALVAVSVEVAAFIAWRLWLRTRSSTDGRVM